jgi:hypothetical protein
MTVLDLLDQRLYRQRPIPSSRHSCPRLLHESAIGNKDSSRSGGMLRCFFGVLFDATLDMLERAPDVKSPQDL